ncbi:MAG: alpha/beta hydrolase [Geminicoccaceae bacterium]
MPIEVVRARPDGARRPVSLVFVHGIIAGAWIWQEHFLPYFVDCGYPVYAVNLRGHGKSEGREQLVSAGLADFTADLNSALDGLDLEPDDSIVLVGFSMGGAVVQNYLRTGGSASGMVLLSSVPPYGLARANFELAMRDPVLWAELAKLAERGLEAVDPQLIRKALFSDISDAGYDAFLAKADPMSLRISWDMQGFPPIAPLPVNAPPTYVLGGSLDKMVPMTDCLMTAAYFGAPVKVIAGAAHTLMLEPQWREVADSIQEWLVHRFPG